MSVRSKYSLNGVYRCENFAQHVAHDNFPTVPIGSAGGINGWFVTLQTTNNQNNNPVIYHFIFAYNKPTLRLRCYFNVINKDGSSRFQTRGRLITGPSFGAYGEDMKIADLLNQDNGYLDDDGGLTVGYGIHIDGIQGPLSFHSPHFQNQLTKLEGIRRHDKWIIEECLQIAHGVRIPLKTSSLKIASIAHDNNLRNVVHYADQQLVQNDWCANITELIESDVFLFEDCIEFELRYFLACLVDPDEGSKIFLFENCIKFGLRHYLAHLVDHFECLKDLKNIIEQLNIEKMSGEAMKTFAAKIFDLGS